MSETSKLKRPAPVRVQPVVMRRFEAEIEATHPMNDYTPEREAAIFAADRLAMELVGERHEKRELVNLVRWLILRQPDGLI